MDIEKLHRVAVIGGGQMGRQIAMNTAIYGYDVCVTDSIPKVLEDVEKWSDQYLKGRIEKGRMTEEKVEDVRRHFHIINGLVETVSDAGLVIEAIIEDKDKKSELFKQLNNLAEKDAVLVTNSSYIVSSSFAEFVDNPSRLANFHYFNPALVLKLVEVVQGAHTSNETIDFLMEFARRTGKTPIRVNKEIDGFVVNRIMRAMRDEAYSLVEKGICTPQEVDLGVELGLKHPMGPFRLNDLTGIDSTYYQNERRLKETGKMPPGYNIVKAKFEAHEWGRKTGKGFYEYNDNEKK
jgi:3-hydroxybutyryl-CoA dehydrogenase